MKKKIKGFTLAEILGIIVIIGVIIILVAPPIIKQLNSKKNETKQTVNELIYMASSQYIKEHPRNYKAGKRYCLKIQDLISAGKLTSPLIDVADGTILDNYSVLATIYSSGDENYKLVKGSASEIDTQCSKLSTIPLITFVVTPNTSKWEKTRQVEVIYPEGAEDKNYKKDSDSNWKTAGSGNPKEEFKAEGIMHARMKYDGETIEDICKITKVDGIPPTVKRISTQADNGSSNMLVELNDTGGSGLKGYIINKDSTTKPKIDSAWKLIVPTTNDAKVTYKITDNGKYYIYAIDNALNISDVTEKTFRIKNTVTYDPNGGTLSDSYKTEVVTNGGKYKLPTPSKTGYTFTGWYTAKTGGTQRKPTDLVNLNNDETLYAHWTANTYKIKFNANLSGTSGTMSDKTCTYDQECTLPNISFSKSKYFFLGWSKTASGSKEYADGAKVKNLTTSPNATVDFYGVWAEACSKVTYKDGTTCNKKCGGGTYNRLAYSYYDGSRCSNKDVPSGGSSCNTKDCCSSVRYEEGTTCSKSCGGGTYNQIAYSNYDDSRCPSKDKSSGGKSCNTRECCSKTEYKAGSWGAWSTCTKKCGTGSHTRTRSVSIVSYYDNSITCPSAQNSVNSYPSTSDTQNCNTQSCCSSVTYTNGSTCSAACDGGTYNQLAYSAYDGTRCPSSDKSTGGSSCNTQDCCSKTTYKEGMWSSWGECSADCGGGTKSRSRNVSIVSAYNDDINCSKASNSTNSAPSTSESQSCNTHACASTCTTTAKCSCKKGSYGPGGGQSNNNPYGGNSGTSCTCTLGKCYQNNVYVGSSCPGSSGGYSGYNSGSSGTIYESYPGDCTYTGIVCYMGSSYRVDSTVAGCNGNEPIGYAHYTGDSYSGDPCTPGTTNCDDAGCNSCNSHGAWGG